MKKNVSCIVRNSKIILHKWRSSTGPVLVYRPYFLRVRSCKCNVLRAGIYSQFYKAAEKTADCKLLWLYISNCYCNHVLLTSRTIIQLCVGHVQMMNLSYYSYEFLYRCTLIGNDAEIFHKISISASEIENLVRQE